MRRITIDLPDDTSELYMSIGRFIEIDKDVTQYKQSRHSTDLRKYSHIRFDGEKWTEREESYQLEKKV